jgi:hypothetical protein
MKSKKISSRELLFWTPTKNMYASVSSCLQNDIKAYIVLDGKGFKIELNYKGTIKPDQIFYEKQAEAEKAIWKLYEQICSSLKKKL